MIAPNNMISGRKDGEHWRWYANALPLSDLSPKDCVIRKKASSRFWWFRRFERCCDDDVVIRRKTEISQEVLFGRTPAYARISSKRIARRKADVLQLGSVEANRTICIRRRASGEWTDIAFGDCRTEDFVLCRVKHQGAWESESLSRCEYSDFVACVDFRAILHRVFFCLLGLAICAIIVAVAVLIANRTHSSEVPSEQRKPKVISEAPARPNTKKPLKAKEAPKPPSRIENGQEVVSSTTSTNSNGVVIEKLVLADGSKMSKIHPPPPVFSNPSDQVIALAISTPPGQAMPPLPDLQGIDKDFMKSLLSPIEIDEDDTDEIKALKVRVIEVKKELVEEIKNGGSVQDVLLAHQKEMNRLSDSRLMAIQEMQRIAGEEGIEAAQEFADKVNEHFSEQGIPEIPVIGTHEEKDRRR